MEGKITYAEINEWARSWGDRGYYYRKIHPTYKVLGLKITQYGDKILFVSNYFKEIVYELGYFNGHNSKELLTNFVSRMKKQGWWEGKFLNYGECFKDYGLPIDAFAPNDEEKIFSTPVEAKPSPTNSDVPHFKTVVAHNYEESKPQIEPREPEDKEASNVKEVKVGKPFLISLLEYFFKK